MDEYLFKLTLSIIVFLSMLVTIGAVIFRRHNIISIINNIPNFIKNIILYIKRFVFFNKYMPLRKNKKDILNTYNKIQSIKNNIIILSEHINMLDELTDEDIFKFQKYIIEHFILYYNKYCSIYLKLIFIKHLETIKLNKKVLNINYIVSEINNEIKKIKNDITTFPENITINYNIIEATFLNIGRKTKKLTHELIIKETIRIIKNTSPIEEKNNVNNLLNKTNNSEAKNELIILNDEYAKFLGEIEVNNIK